MTTPTAARDRTRATGADLREALRVSSAWLNVNAERINALNVFPVPDGDTGTNMSMTLRAAVDGLSQLSDAAPASQVAHSAYAAAMLGARGNSGVILSQLLSGFAKAADGATELTPTLLAAALTEASDVAYRGLSRPVEGTILTVAREAAQAARSAAEAGADVPELLQKALASASAAVAATPDQLDVLRKAGVVDAGGEGYRVILEGAWMFATGRSIEDAAPLARPYSRALLDAFGEEEESLFGFCTEFLLRDSDLPLADVKQAMEALGESVIAVGDTSLLRVHLHTLRPGQALEFAVDHGTLARVKVENMQLQHAEFAAGGGGAEAVGNQPPPASTIGVIAVGAGDGFLRVFKSLGARVVRGGQTMNPSVQEILAAVNSAGCAELIILPNNRNVILTARQVQELTPHRVKVVPTETAPQGIGALLAFNFQTDLDTNVAAMEQAAHGIHTVEVTRAVRDAEIDGVQVKAGEMLGVYDGRIVGTRASADEALLASVAQVSVDALEIVTIYYGAGASQDDAQAVAGRLRGQHPGLAVEVVEGGQPHYPYIVSLE